MYKTRKKVFDHTIQRVTEYYIFDELRGVWKFGQILCFVFDISSQSIPKLRRKRRIKIVKLYANWDQISKHRHSHYFQFVWTWWIINVLLMYMYGVKMQYLLFIVTGLAKSERNLQQLTGIITFTFLLIPKRQVNRFSVESTTSVWTHNNGM